MATEASLKYVQQMFVAYLGRAAAEGAQNYYADLIDADETLGKAQMFDDLYNSAEGQALYGSMTTDQVINQIFQNCFERDAAFAGLTYYYNAIGDGTFNILEAAAVIADDASNPADVAVFDSKKTAADKITVAIGSDATAAAEYAANAEAARTSLNKVTDSASAAAFDGAAELAAVRSGNQVGATTPLTTKADTVNGTSGNDTITGTDTTLTNGDVITDGFGTDNDTLALTGAQFVNSITTANTTISGIENITGTFDSLTNFTLNLAGLADDSNITVSNVRDGSTANATVSNVTNNSTVNAGSGLAGDLTVTMDAANSSVTVNSTGVTGTTTVTASGTGSVVVNSDKDAVTAASANGAITVTAAGAATGAISGTATTTAGNTANVLVTADSALGTVTADTDRGNATVHADATATTVTATADAGTATVDAAKSLAITTTGVTTNITSGATGTTTAPVVINVTGTTGSSDTATITAKGVVTLTNNANLEGLTLSGNGASVTYNAAASEKVTLTGDQSVTFAGTAAVVAGTVLTDSTTAGTTTASVTTADTGDFSKVGADVLSFATATGNETYTVANGQNVVITAAPTGNTDVITLDVDDDDAANTIAAGSIDLTLQKAFLTGNQIKLDTAGDKATTLNVTSTVAQTALNIDTGATTGTKIDVASSKAITIDANSKAAEWDGSDVTGIVTGSQTANLLVVKGGSGNDVLTVTTNTAKSAVYGNGGNDEIKIGAVTLVATQTLDGGAGTDTLTVTGNADVSAGTLTGIDLIANGANTLQISEGQATAGLVITGTGAITVDDLDAAVDLSGLLFSGAGSTVIDAAANSTASLGAAASRSIVGTSVADTITGASGADTIDGGKGDDNIDGNGGADALIGGAGSNTYIYNTGDAATGETITFNTAAGATETISVVTTTDLSAINGGALLTGLDAITLTATKDATLLGSQITGLAIALNGATGDDFTINGTTAAETIDLSKTTMRAGTDTIVDLKAGNDTFVGTTLIDTVTGGTGADTMTGGTGADVFVIAAATDTGITVATADTIKDFVSGTDKLSLGLAGNATANNAAENYGEAAAAVADFAAALSAANNALAVLNANGNTTAAALYNFQFDATNGYLFIDTDSDGDADAVVVLTGIDNTEIAETDIIA